MFQALKLIGAIVAAIALWVGWAALAQVQEKSKDKASAAPKTPVAAPKTAADPAGKKPAAPGAAPKEAGAAKKPAAAAPPAADTAESADEAAIRKGAEAFVAAYNGHDAKAVSELFALKAEFTDEDGNLIKGRAAIAQDFAAMFAANPACKIAVEVDSIRVLTPNIAVEEGIVRGQPSPEAGENVSSYLAVHVKVDGKWLIASVSDFEADPENLTAGDNLQQLAWMVGDWIDESPDSVAKSWDPLESTCRHASLSIL